MEENDDQNQQGSAVPPHFEQGKPPQPPVDPQPPSPGYIHYTTGGETPPQIPTGNYYANSSGNMGPKNSTNAIVSLVLGIIAFLFSFGCVCLGMRGALGVVLGIVGLVFGIMANSEIKKSNGTVDGKNLATAGMALSVFGIVVGIIMTIVSISSIVTVSG